MSWFAKKSQTVKPTKKGADTDAEAELKKHALAVLGSGDLLQAVELPEGEDVNEWLAVNSTFSSVLNRSLLF